MLYREEKAVICTCIIIKYMLYREEKAVICTCIIIKYMLYREGEGSHMYNA